MNAKEIRIVFMGTPQISAKVLRGLLTNGYNVIGVVAQPDRPIGRKRIMQPVPTKVVAEEFNIPTFQPEKIRNDYSFLNDLKPDLILTIAYGQIVPTGVLEIPTYGALNLHGSLLPKYRGAAPIQYSLINNDTVTGMTLMKMVKGMDAGEMYAKKEILISEDDNSTSLFEKMGDLALSLTLESLQDYLDGKLIGEEQGESQVSFAPSIKPEEEHIDFSKSAREIFGLIRGLSDTPGANCLLNDSKIKIFKAKVVDEVSEGEIGKIVNADKTGLVVQTGKGKIAILELQKEGKNRMDYKSFLNGNPKLLGLLLK